MNKLFIEHPVFRLLSPLFSGILVYLLILLIGNQVDQLKETFLSQELYVCIGLAYVIQEFARMSLSFFDRLSWFQSFIVKVIGQIIISVIITIVLVSTVMYLYFVYIQGYTPNLSELTIFNSIFSIITLIYISLYLSHQFLHKANTKIFEQELLLKENLDNDFKHLQKGFNPTLLFESLESLIILMRQDVEKAENLIDHFSAVYRYILSTTKNELVSIQEELTVVDELLLLFAHLPYRKTSYAVTSSLCTLIVPGSLLFLFEQIIRCTIVSKQAKLVVELFENENVLLLKYAHQDKIMQPLSTTKLTDLHDAYRFYTDKKINLTKDDTYTIINIPKLIIDESSNY